MPSTQLLHALIDLTLNRNSDGIKKVLETAEPAIKGELFEEFLAELYRGNGWIAHRSGGAGDQGGDVLLFHPKSLTVVRQIVQAKNQKHPLNFDATKLELMKFEEQAGPAYKCKNYAVVSINGFVAKAKELQKQGVNLYDFSYVQGLIEKYETDGSAEPEIDLLPHNQAAFEAVMSQLDEFGNTSVVQATGTGKTFIALKVLSRFMGQQKLLMAPSNYILNQFVSRLPWMMGDDFTLLTYSKAARMSKDEVLTLKPEVIVLDEFHRCGAQEWGRGVQQIIQANPQAKVLGTSATPTRFLDGMRDMAEELFEGRVASELSLQDAIARGILPVPKYISALYTIENELSKIQAELKEAFNEEEEKDKLIEQIKQFEVSWKHSNGIPQILKKHIPQGAMRFIIFCKDKEHLMSIQPQVFGWFQETGMFKAVKIHRIISGESENYAELSTFKKGSGKGVVHLLFTIDMLNEGLHIPSVDGVVLLRPTESPNIFFQQIGRALDAAQTEKQPLILDFVDNLANIHTSDLLAEIEQSIHSNNNERERLGLPKKPVDITFTDETRNLTEFITKLRKKLVRTKWELMYGLLAQCKDEFGHFELNVAKHYKRELELWISRQRTYRKKGTLNKEHEELLNEIGFHWDKEDERWYKSLVDLTKFFKKCGHFEVVESDGWYLYHFVADVRADWYQGTLPQKKIETLNSIRFDWEPLWTRHSRIKREEINALYNTLKDYDLTAERATDKQYTLQYERNKNGKFSGSLVGFDMVATASTVDGLKWALARELIEYAEEYWLEGHWEVPNRAEHEQFVWNILSKHRVSFRYLYDVSWPSSEVKKLVKMIQSEPLERQG